MEDNQPVLRCPLASVQGGQQRTAVQGSELRQTPEDGSQHLMEPGEAHAGLELSAGDTQHLGAGGLGRLRGRIQEHGLTDTGFARKQECSASRGGLLEEGGDQPEFSVTSRQCRSDTARGRIGGRICPSAMCHGSVPKVSLCH